MVYKLWAVREEVTSSDLNTYLAKQVVIVCTSGTRPSSPPEGMTVYETDTDVIRVYSGAAWKRFAVDLETAAPVEIVESTAVTGFTNTTFAAGSPVCGLTFVAPPSGSVYATVSGMIEMANDGNVTRLSYEVRASGTIGSGTVVFSAVAERGISCGKAVNAGAAAVLSASRRALLGTLTPGSTYNARTMHLVTGGTGAATNRALLIEPVR